MSSFKSNENIHKKEDGSYANNKDADHPAHLFCLISTFVVSCLGSIIMSPTEGEGDILFLVRILLALALASP